MTAQRGKSLFCYSDAFGSEKVPFTKAVRITDKIIRGEGVEDERRERHS